MNKKIWAVSSLLLWVCWGMCFGAEDKYFSRPPRFNILVIYSSNSSNEAALSLSNGVTNALLKRDVAYSMESFELNMLYDQDPQIWLEYLDSYQMDIEREYYHLIITEGSEACETLLKRLDRIPQKVQIIFTNIPAWEQEKIRAIHPNATAVLRPNDPSPNVTLGMKLFPETKEVVLLTTSYEWSRYATVQWRNLLPDTVNSKIIFFDNDRPEILQNVALQLKHLSPQSLVVAMDLDKYFASKASSNAVWKWIHQQYSGPILTSRMSSMEENLGGNFSPLSETGMLAGEFAERIASGMNAEHIKPVFCPKSTFFNYNTLKRFHISESQLPEGCIILNQPEVWYLRHARALTMGASILVALCLVLGGVVIALSLNRRKIRLENVIHKALPVRVFVFDRAGNILYLHVEQGVPSSMDRTRKYQHASELPWIQTRNLLDTIANVYDSGEPFVMDYSFYGEERTVLFSRIDKNVFGQVAVICVSSDSSRLVKLQQETQENATRLALILQSLDEAVIVTDQEQRVSRINPVAARQLGISADEAIGQKIDAIFQLENNGQSLPSPVKEVFVTGKSTLPPQDSQLIRKDGEKVFVDGRISPVRDAAGKLIGAVIVFQDITEQYEKQRELSTAKLLLDAIAKYSEISFFTVNLDTLQVLPVHAKKLRHCPTRNGVAIWREWIVPEDCEKIQNILADFKRGATQAASIVAATNYSGVIQYFHIQFVASGGTDVPQVIGICHDVTVERSERIRHQEEAALLAIIEESLPYPIFVKDIEDNFRYIRCNRALREQWSLSTDEIIGKTDYDLIVYGIDADALRKHDVVVAQTNKMHNFIEEYHMNNGNDYQFHSIKQVITNSSGRRLLLGITTDISQEETFRMATEESMTLLKSILDSLPAEVYVKDASHEFRYIIWNKPLEESSLLSQHEVIGHQEDELNLVAAGVLPSSISDNELLLKGNPHFERKTIANPRRGEVTYDTYQIPITQGDRQLILGMRMDVTEQLELQNVITGYQQNDKLLTNALRTIVLERDFRKALQQLLALYAQAARADRSFIFRWENNLFNKEFEWVGEESHSLLAGYTTSELCNWDVVLKRNEFIRIEDVLSIPPELAGTEETLMAEQVKSIMVAPFFLNGKFYGFIGFDFRHKQVFSPSIENILHELVELYLLAYERDAQRKIVEAQFVLQSKIMEEMDTPVALFDPNGKLMIGNSAYYTLWNFKAEVVTGKNCHDFCPYFATERCTPEHCAALYCRTFQTKHSVITMVGKRTVKTTATTIADEHGELRYVLQSFMDISDWNDEKTLLEGYIEQSQVIQDCMSSIVTAQESSQPFRGVINRIAEYYRACSVTVRQLQRHGEHWVAHSLARYERNGEINGALEDISIEDTSHDSAFATLCNGKILVYSLHEVAPNAGQHWQQELESYLETGARTGIVMVPLFLHGESWGYFALEVDCPEVKWAESDLRFFENIGKFFELLLERETQQEDRDQAATLHKQIFANIDYPMVLLDPSRKILAINNKCSELLGAAPDTLVGCQCSDRFCHEADNRELCNDEACPIRYAMAKGAGYSMEYDRNGRILRLQTQPIFALDGTVRYVLESVIDFTEERMKQTQMQTQKEELQRYNEELATYVAQDRILAKCLEMMLLEHDTEPIWNDMLALLGPQFHADHCAVVQYIEEQHSAVMRNVWSAEDAKGSHQVGERFPVKNLNAFLTELKSGNSVHARKCDLNSNVAWQKECLVYFKRTHQVEILAAPLKLYGVFWGYLGIEQSGVLPFSSCNIRLLNNAVHLVEVLLERDQQMKTIRIAENEKQIILDTLHIPLMLLDEKLNICNGNKALEEFKQLLGPVAVEKRYPACDFCPERGACQHPEQEIHCVFAKTFASGVDQSCSFSVGEHSYILNSSAIFSGNQVFRVLVSILDVSDATKSRELLEQALVEAQRSIRGKSAFVVAFSRKLIQTISDLLHAIEEEALQLSGKELLHVINEVMEVNMIEAEEIKPHWKTVNLDGFFAEIIAENQARTEAKQLTLTFFRKNEMPEIQIDVDKVRKIVTNILDYSIGYTVSGGIEISAEIQEGEASGQSTLKIAIRDTGLGIPDELQKNLFELCADDDDSFSVNHDRFNLIISAKLIRLLNGSIHLKSKLGKGSCFNLEIPIAGIPMAAAKNASASENVSTNGILIVDDVRMNLKVLGAILKRLGYETYEAESGKQALEWLQRVTPKMILTDVWMPEINGVDLARQIRSNSRYASIPIYAVTADAESKRNFDMDVFDSVIIKPVTMEKLATILNQAQSQSQA